MTHRCLVAKAPRVACVDVGCASMGGATVPGASFQATGLPLMGFSTAGFWICAQAMGWVGGTQRRVGAQGKGGAEPVGGPPAVRRQLRAPPRPARAHLPDARALGRAVALRLGLALQHALGDVEAARGGGL